MKNPFRRKYEVRLYWQKYNVTTRKYEPTVDLLRSAKFYNLDKAIMLAWHWQNIYGYDRVELVRL